jgi:hypothetical protein
MKKIITLTESQLINLINKWVSNHIINEGGLKKFVSKPSKYYLDKVIFKKIDEITGENCFIFDISQWDEGERPGFSGMVNYYKDSYEFNPEDTKRSSFPDIKAIQDKNYNIRKSLSNLGDIIAVGDIYSSSNRADVEERRKDFINTWMDENITPEKIKSFIVDKGYKTKADFLNDVNNNNNLITNIHTIYTQAERTGILDKIFNEKPDSIKKTKNIGKSIPQQKDNSIKKTKNMGKSIPQQKANGDSSYFKSTTTNPNYDFKYKVVGGSNKKLG